MLVVDVVVPGRMSWRSAQSTITNGLRPRRLDCNRRRYLHHRHMTGRYRRNLSLSGRIIDKCGR